MIASEVLGWPLKETHKLLSQALSAGYSIFKQYEARINRVKHMKNNGIIRAGDA